MLCNEEMKNMIAGEPNGIFVFNKKWFIHELPICLTCFNFKPFLKINIDDHKEKL